MKLTRRSTAALTALCLGVAMLAAAPPSYAARDKSHGDSHGSSHGNSHDKGCHRIGSVRTMLECVTLPGVMEHEWALQKIANANGGTRASATPGYDASAAYVIKRMRKAGYRVSTQTYQYFKFEVVGASALEQTAPGSVTYVEDTDFAPTPHSEPGDVTAAVTPVDVQLGLGNTSTSGCEAADFAGFPAGNIALIQRGTCTFEIKGENAAAAGASARPVLQPGQHRRRPDRNGIPAVTLGNGYTGGIPALNATYALGATLSGITGLHDAAVRERESRGRDDHQRDRGVQEAVTRGTS